MQIVAATDVGRPLHHCRQQIENETPSCPRAWEQTSVTAITEPGVISVFVLLVALANIKETERCSTAIQLIAK